MSLAATRFIAVLLSVVAVGVLLALGAQKLFGAAAGADAELITRLKQSEKSGLSLPIPGAADPLVARSHRYDRFTPWLDPGSGALMMDTTLEFSGRLGRVEVGGFTSEKLVFRQVDGDWEPVEGYAPSLTAVVKALQARRAAVEQLDLRRLDALRLEAGTRPAPALDGQELQFLAQLRNRSYNVKAWYIRAEPDEAIVTEDYRLTGDLPDRPVDHQGSRRLTLKRSGGEFFFSPGIM